MTSAPVEAQAPAPARVRPGRLYAYYVLGVLTLVYVINFIDRQILSILAEDIKVDLGVSDAQIGFLYGTAFALFYAIFGIPLGRLADLWVRTRLIAIGLAVWSFMTALSGAARNFPMLAACRLGVGVGEASANPATYSLLADYFPPSIRTIVMSIFSSGGYIGLGVGVFLGGAILNFWNGAYPDPAAAPAGLAGWQAAFLAVGLPGLLMALLVVSLREPKRGETEGIETAAHPSPFRETAKEVISIVPPLTVIGLWAVGYRAGGLALNLGFAALVVLGAWALTVAIGEPQQWFALAIGLYGFFSWAQSLARRDPPTFHLMFRSRGFVLSAIGFPCLAFVSYGINFWSAPLIIRSYDVTPGEVGMYVGLSLAIGGWAGVTLGGVLADWLAKYIRASRHLLGLISAASSLPLAVLMLNAASLHTAIALYFAFIFCLSLWFGPAYASVVDLVLPRMRALATALMIFMATFVGLAFGPFTIGLLSDLLIARGHDAAGALRAAMMCSLSMLAVGFALLWAARASMEADTALKLVRARAAGENV